MENRRGFFQKEAKVSLKSAEKTNTGNQIKKKKKNSSKTKTEFGDKNFQVSNEQNSIPAFKKIKKKKKENLNG